MEEDEEGRKALEKSWVKMSAAKVKALRKGFDLAAA